MTGGSVAFEILAPPGGPLVTTLYLWQFSIDKTKESLLTPSRLLATHMLALNILTYKLFATIKPFLQKNPVGFVYSA